MSKHAPAGFATARPHKPELEPRPDDGEHAPQADRLLIDPRSCLLCGLTIDHHHMIDDGDGPQHFCISELYERIAAGKAGRATAERPFFLGWNAGIDFALVHVAEEEISMIMSGIMAESDTAPSIIPPRAPKPYRPAASTVDAFLYLVSLKDPDRLVAWLQERERDRPFLLKLLEAK